MLGEVDGLGVDGLGDADGLGGADALDADDEGDGGTVAGLGGAVVDGSAGLAGVVLVGDGLRAAVVPGGLVVDEAPGAVVPGGAEAAAPVVHPARASAAVTSRTGHRRRSIVVRRGRPVIAASCVAAPRAVDDPSEDDAR